MVIGVVVVEEFFGEIDFIGWIIKMMGCKYEVIGVIEKLGDVLLNLFDFDDCLFVFYNNVCGLVNLKVWQIFDIFVNVKVVEGVSMQ